MRARLAKHHAEVVEFVKDWLRETKILPGFVFTFWQSKAEMLFQAGHFRNRMQSGVVFTVLMSLPFYCSFASAQSIPNAKQCVATLPRTGQQVRVRDHIGLSNFVAFASYDADGWPAITYAPSYFSLPPTVQTFLSLHECGHLVLHTTDEFVANCYAIAQGHWTANELALIAVSHLSVGRLPPQYGGSGTAFWGSTKATCPAYFR